MTRQRLIFSFLLIVAVILTGFVVKDVWGYYTKQKEQKAQDRIDLFHMDLQKDHLKELDRRLIDSSHYQKIILYDSLLACLSDLDQGIMVSNERVENIFQQLQDLEIFNYFSNKEILKEIGEEYSDETYLKFLNNPVQLRKYLFNLIMLLTAKSYEWVHCVGIECSFSHIELTYGRRPGVKDSFLIFFHEDMCPPNLCSNFTYYFVDDFNRNFTYLNTVFELRTKNKFKNYLSINPKNTENSRLSFHIINLPH